MEMFIVAGIISLELLDGNTELEEILCHDSNFSLANIIKESKLVIG